MTELDRIDQSTAMTFFDGKYFQKSTYFLYPLLEIPRSLSIQPTGTYLWQENGLNIKHAYLYVVYDYQPSNLYFIVLQKALADHKRFVSANVSRDRKHIIYLFRLSDYEPDFDRFMRGKYSEFSSESKDKIRDYYGKESMTYAALFVFLYPELCYDHFWSLSGKSKEDIREELELCSNVTELCCPYDKDQETLKMM